MRPVSSRTPYGTARNSVPGEVHRRPVRQVAAVRQRQPEQRVARLEQRRGRRPCWPAPRSAAARWRARRRTAALRAIDRQLLDLVHDLAAAVVALSRQALGVLVGERRAHRLEHRRRDEVLARDQLEAVLLARRLRGRIEAREPSGSAPAQARRRVGRVTASIFSTRRSWRPPSNGVSSQRCRMSMLSSSLMNRAGSTRTLASLCFARQLGDFRAPDHARPARAGSGWRRTTCRGRCRRGGRRASPRRC